MMRFAFIFALVAMVATPALAADNTATKPTTTYETVKKNYGSYVGFNKRQRAFRDDVMAKRRQGTQNPAAAVMDIVPAAGNEKAE